MEGKGCSMALSTAGVWRAWGVDEVRVQNWTGPEGGNRASAGSGAEGGAVEALQQPCGVGTTVPLWQRRKWGHVCWPITALQVILVSDRLGLKHTPDSGLSSLHAVPVGVGHSCCEHLPCDSCSASRVVLQYGLLKHFK